MTQADSEQVQAVRRAVAYARKANLVGAHDGACDCASADHDMPSCGKWAYQLAVLFHLEGK